LFFFSANISNCLADGEKRLDGGDGNDGEDASFRLADSVGGGDGEDAD
jgi:hypothetical protein